MNEQLGHIIDHVLGSMWWCGAAWESLEAILQEVQGGQIYRRRCVRGARAIQ